MILISCVQIVSLYIRCSQTNDLRSQSTALSRAFSFCAGGQKCISQSNDRSLRVLTSEPQHYTFDAVAGEDADQDVIFQGEAFARQCMVRMCNPNWLVLA